MLCTHAEPHPYAHTHYTVDRRARDGRYDIMGSVIWKILQLMFESASAMEIDDSLYR